jgi:cell division protein FtsI (penicillin-binding protein 3)
VIKPETAITMRQMMEGVVLHGTGGGARVQGYSVGGKTGSAQIFDNVAHRYTHTYNGSFLGFAPIQNPQIVVIVTLNGTHGTSGFGGAAAAPVFKAVAAEALRVLEVPKDVPDELPLPTLVAAELSDLSDADSTAQNILEDGEEDAEPAAAPVGPRIDAVAAPAKPAGPRVPNFLGKSLRAVLTEAQAKGVTVSPNGSGIARVQQPPAGSILHEGERIRVQFSR